MTTARKPRRVDLDKRAERIRQIVDQAPPLTPEQIARLRILLQPAVAEHKLAA